jgi:riboflavin kinase / FMN adenylyltransferase
VLLEVFLFDFSGDLYGRTLDVAFIGWIRPEMTFESVADLTRRMGDDCSLAGMALKRAGDAFPPLGPLSSGLSAAGSM